MAALQRNQLNRLCSSSEIFKKAESILHLANAKTRPGSGFVVKTPIAIPGVCAYLASEQLNAGEVSLQSAMSAACVTRAEFFDTLNKVRAALHAEEGSTTPTITYETLVDAYHIHPRADAIACMEDTEAALPRADILKEKHGKNTFSCAIFYWVCQLMEEHTVQKESLCRSYSVSPRTLKAFVTMLDEQCNGVAEQIQSYLLKKRSSAEASTSSRLGYASKSTSASPEKSIMKAGTTQSIARKVLASATTPSRKRIVAFSNLSDGGGGSDGRAFPETPTKKRRIEAPSPTKPRHTKIAEVTVTPIRAELQPSQSSPSRSQGRMSPARLAARHRFRPVFLDQQQWCARDPKVERMLAVAESLRDKMVELHGHLFQGT